MKDAVLQVHEGGTILLKDIVDLLRAKGYSFKAATFSYFSYLENGFVYCGKEPSTEPTWIRLSDIHSRLILKIRCMSERRAPAAQPVAIPQPPKVKPPERREHIKRNKERKIGDIIEKVGEWRTLYTGAPDASGKVVKYSLEEAANMIGIAKKTLDDYLLQLRAGKKYGFDFHANKDAKVGVLRAFVKTHKRKDRDGRNDAQSNHASYNEDEDGMRPEVTPNIGSGQIDYQSPVPASGAGAVAAAVSATPESQPQPHE